MPPPTSDVEVATLARDGPPPITRTTVPTCRSTPADRASAHVDCLPRSRGLPPMAGGSASALSLSRPAQALLTLRPAGSLSRPQATFVTRLQPVQLPAQAARQLPDQSTTLRVDSSSTDDSRLRGALPLPDSRAAAKSGRFQRGQVCQRLGPWDRSRSIWFDVALAIRSLGLRGRAALRGHS